jgi:hypothetical protein
MRPSRPEEPKDLTRDAKAFTAAIRARAFAFLRGWSTGRDEEALVAIDSPTDDDGQPWTPERLAAAREAHRAEHPGGIRLDPEARNLRHTHVEAVDEGAGWLVRQMIVDADGINDWVLELDADVEGSRDRGEPVLKLLRLGPLV